MRRFKFALCAITIFTLTSAGVSTTCGNIFVEDGGNSQIGEYTDSGTIVNASLIPNSLITNNGGIAASVSDLFVTQRNDTVAEYTTSGALVNPALISTPGFGSYGSESIALSGSDLFLLSGNNPANGGWVVGEYTTSGEPVNVSLISGPGDPYSDPSSIAVAGSDIFVWTFDGLFGGNTIAEYDTSGNLINPSLISFPGNSNGGNLLAISGSDLFISQDNGVISEYTTSGSLVNPNLVLEGGAGIAVDGSDLFVIQNGGIGEYTTSGATVNPALVTGLVYPWGIAITDVPEPASLSLLFLGGVPLLSRRRR